MSGSDSALLVHPDYRGQVTSSWFDPGAWGGYARPVDSGGRGNAWFIDGYQLAVVLREYRRGGLIARLSEASYLFLRESDVRAFAEFRLLNVLADQGLPVPKPVAARYQRKSPFLYCASIIIERIADSVPLADRFLSMELGLWHRLGRVLRRFHDAGVMHADLNCYNILVQGDDFYLIDFDKSRIRGESGAARWKKSTLDRLYRSLKKVAGKQEQGRLETRWVTMNNGYDGKPFSD